MEGAVADADEDGSLSAARSGVVATIAEQIKAAQMAPPNDKLDCLG